jgi:hypothetical protein
MMALFKLEDAKDLVLTYQERRHLCEDANALAEAKGWL